MYPHERSLVKRLAEKPFALVGINSDDKPETLKEVIAKESMTWPSWFDGGTDGPIAKKWNVQGWPTIYVLEDLDAAVDTLLEEQAAETRKSKE